MLVRIFLAIAAAFFACAQPAYAKALVDPTFTFRNEPVKIAVFRPEVKVGSLGVGGVDEANADWTSAARENLENALKSYQRLRGNETIFLADQEGEAAQTLADYQALFRLVASAVLESQTSRLPTMKKGGFEWSLGPEAIKLKELTGANYGLIFFSNDSFGTAGRKVAQAIFAAVFRVAIPAGVHMSYAALVDFQTGRMVWFNFDPAAGGDPREMSGAAERIEQIFQSMPARPGSAPQILR